jgi:hypothetical protein
MRMPSDAMLLQSRATERESRVLEVLSPIVDLGVARDSSSFAHHCDGFGHDSSSVGQHRRRFARESHAVAYH